jgi:hypothetical protein
MLLIGANNFAMHVSPHIVDVDNDVDASTYVSDIHNEKPFCYNVKSHDATRAS